MKKLLIFAIAFASIIEAYGQGGNPTLVVATNGLVNVPVGRIAGRVGVGPDTTLIDITNRTLQGSWSVGTSLIFGGAVPAIDARDSTAYLDNLFLYSYGLILKRQPAIIETGGAWAFGATRSATSLMSELQVGALIVKPQTNATHVASIDTNGLITVTGLTIPTGATSNKVWTCINTTTGAGSWQTGGTGTGGGGDVFTTSNNTFVVNTTNIFNGAVRINSNLFLSATAANSGGGIIYRGTGTFIHDGAGDNFFMGYNAGLGYIGGTGAGNTAIGTLAMSTPTDVTQNGATCFGYEAGWSNGQAGVTYIGYRAGKFNTSGGHNTVVGASALGSQGDDQGANTAIGYNCMFNSGADGFEWPAALSQNCGFGDSVLYNLIGNNGVNAAGNSASGYHALYGMLSGSYNTAWGYYAGVTTNAANSSVNDSTCTYLGAYSGKSTPNQLIGATAIGYQSEVNASNTVQIGRPTDNVIAGNIYLSNLATKASVTAVTNDANIAMLNRNPQTFTGANTFTQLLTLDSLVVTNTINQINNGTNSFMAFTGFGTTTPGARVEIHGIGVNTNMALLRIIAGATRGTNYVAYADSTTNNQWAVGYDGRMMSKGLYYPLTDGPLSGSAIVTDGAKSLSWSQGAVMTNIVSDGNAVVALTNGTAYLSFTNFAQLLFNGSANLDAPTSALNIRALFTGGSTINLQNVGASGAPTNTVLSVSAFNVTVGTNGSAIRIMATATASLIFTNTLSLGGSETNKIAMTGAIPGDFVGVAAVGLPSDSVWRGSCEETNVATVWRQALATNAGTTNTFRCELIGH